MCSFNFFRVLAFFAHIIKLVGKSLRIKVYISQCISSHSILVTFMQGRFPPQQEQYTFTRLYYDVNCLFHSVSLHYTNIDYTTLHSLRYNILQQTTLLFTAHTTLHCTTLQYTNIYLLVTDPPHTNSSIDNGTHS